MYKSIDDLPAYLREHLPQSTQEVYLITYNNACRDYADPAKHQDFSSLGEVAHHIAWAAVKKEIEKQQKRPKGLGWAGC